MPRPYTVSLDEARPAFVAELTGFVDAAVGLDDDALLGVSRAHGWARVDCLVHVRMGLQELLAGIPASTDDAPSVDAASYWSMWQAQADTDPVPGILMTRRTASAYTRPTLALEHLREVAAGLDPLVARMPDTPVHFQQQTIRAGDLLATWAVELLLHQHDLDAPRGDSSFSPGGTRIARRTAEALDDTLDRTGNDLTVALRGFGRA